MACMTSFLIPDGRHRQITECIQTSCGILRLTSFLHSLIWTMDTTFKLDSRATDRELTFRSSAFASTSDRGWVPGSKGWQLFSDRPRRELGMRIMCSVPACPRTLSPKLLSISCGKGSLAPKSPISPAFLQGRRFSSLEGKCTLTRQWTKSIRQIEIQGKTFQYESTNESPSSTHGIATETPRIRNQNRRKKNTHILKTKLPRCGSPIWVKEEPFLSAILQRLNEALWVERDEESGAEETNAAGAGAKRQTQADAAMAAENRLLLCLWSLAVSDSLARSLALHSLQTSYGAGAGPRTPIACPPACSRAASSKLDSSD